MLKKGTVLERSKLLCFSFSQKLKGFSFSLVISIDCSFTFYLLFSFCWLIYSNLGLRTSGGIGLGLNLYWSCSRSSYSRSSTICSTFCSRMLFCFDLSRMSNANGFGKVTLGCFFTFSNTKASVPTDWYLRGFYTTSSACSSDSSPY